MKRSTPVILLILVLAGISGGINLKERRAEKIFSSGGFTIRVLEAEVKGGIIKIVEPNGEMSLFSEGVKKQELSRIARKQETLMCQLDYFYHRIKRFIERRLARQAKGFLSPVCASLATKSHGSYRFPYL